MRDIVIQDIPFDDNSSYLKGTSLAPPIIKRKLWSSASNSFAENGKDIKNLNLSFIEGQKGISYSEIQGITERLISSGKHVITLGGDHSITYPILKAHRAFYPAITIVHFDAHPDLYSEYDGNKYSHACPFYRIMESNCADRLIQYGVRTLTNDLRIIANKFGVEINEMKNFKDWEKPDLKTPVYISIDLDVFDPGYAPGVSHKESGGMSPREVLNILHSIPVPIIGADIVEYNPNEDINDLTGILAAKLLKEIISLFDLNQNEFK